MPKTNQAMYSGLAETMLLLEEWHKKDTWFVLLDKNGTKKLLNKANSDVKGNGYDDPLEGSLELPK